MTAKASTVVLLAVCCAMAGTGVSQVLPEFVAQEADPWRLATGLILICCAALTARLAWNRPSFRLKMLRPLLVGLVACYVVTVLTVGGEPHARYLLRSLAAIWFVSVVYVANGALPEVRNMLRRPRLLVFLKGLDVFATNLAVFLVLAEISLRVYAAWTGQSLLVRQGLDSLRLAPNRDYGGLLFTNAHGYASREFIKEKRPGISRIAVLGDSFCVGTVRQDHNFLHVLEMLRPDLEVYNFGSSGVGPREYCAILQTEVWQYDPDEVLVCFFVGNDITGWLPLPNSRRLHPESHSLYVFAQRSWKMLREAQRRRSDDRIAQPLAFPPLSRERHLEVESEGLKICRPSQIEAMEKNWQRSLNSLDRFVAACKERRTPVRVLLIPDEFQVNDDLLREVMDHAGVGTDDLDLDLPQRRLHLFLRERDVPHLDLLPIFRRETETYRPRDTHWNEKGNRLAAETLADWIGNISITKTRKGESTNEASRKGD